MNTANRNRDDDPNAQPVDCDICGAVPAAFRVEATQDLRCESCAIRNGYERSGDAYTAARTLGFAVALLREAGLEDDAIIGLTHATLTAPHSTDTYAFGADQFLPGHDRDHPWMVGQEPLGSATGKAS